MNICLLKTLSKWLEVIFISTVSLFNFGYDSKEEIIENDVINKNSSSDMLGRCKQWQKFCKIVKWQRRKRNV